MFTSLFATLQNMAPEDLILAALLIPTAAALLIPLFHRIPNLREAVTLIAAVALATVTWSLYPHIIGGEQPELKVWEVAQGLTLSFRVEPLGMLFGLVASTLWIVNSISASPSPLPQPWHWRSPPTCSRCSSPTSC
jgi:multicomponent Na+:H+ antiporter subunit D